MKTTGHLFVVFDALNIVKGIKTIGGSENQTYYIESKKFVPDRRLTPLIWQPYIYVTDPNGIIPEGDKVNELASSAWYINSIIPENRVSANAQSATVDIPFSVDANNALHVRKNTDKPIQVFFEAEYLDTRKNKTVHVSLTAMISSTSNSEEKPAPKLSLSKPQSWKYSPFENTNKDVVEAKLSQDGQLLSSAVEWCKVENDIEIPLSEKDAFYLGGQNSDKLQVNPSLMPSTLLRARQLSEDVYNRFYGINTEWDGRMQEVMENRNLFVGKRWKTNFIDDEKGNILHEVIKVDPNKTYTVTTDAEEVDGVDSVFVDIKKGEFPSSGGKLRVTRDIPRIVTTDEQGVLVIYLRHQNISGKVVKAEDFANLSRQLKIEIGDKATPYTPAPEDLNYRNCLLKSSNLYFTQGGSGVGYSNKEKHNDGSISWSYDGTGGVSLGWWNAFLNSVHNNNAKKIFKEGDIYTLSYWASGTPGIIPPSILFISKDGYKQPFGRLKDSIQKFSVTGVWRDKYTINTHINCNSVKGDYRIYKFMLCKGNNIDVNSSWTPAPEDLAPDGILKGEYQSDIKFTRYLPKLDTSIEFLTGDTLRAGMTSVRMKAVVKTNKELISNPDKYFDIKWYLEPTSAGAKEEFLGSGAEIEVPVSKIEVKGGRFIPFRFDLKEKLL